MLHTAGTLLIVDNMNTSERRTINLVPYDPPTKQAPNQYSIVNNVSTECLNTA
jgi:hypothetical protein